MGNKTYLSIGGTGGIGNAIVEQLSKMTTNDTNGIEEGVLVFATYHSSQPNIEADNVSWLQMDVADENSIVGAINKLKERSKHIDWVINCVGLLHNKQAQPEKAIRQIETDFFLANMRINALASMLLAKHIRPLLKNAQRSYDTPAIFATISARVGSISDNELGGWYSYRMSKAALNMGMKNLSIEWERALKDVCVIVMQPGTVDTPLSQPFQSNVADDHLFSPAYSAESLLKVLSTLKSNQNGSFLDWAGESIAW